jgi:serine/threonine protein kinase
MVSSARDLKTGSLVAVKKIENIFEHRSLAKRTLRELKLIRYFFHENIMSCERVMRPHNKNFNNM